MQDPDFPTTNSPNIIDVAGRPRTVKGILGALAPHLYAQRLDRMKSVLSHRLSSVALGLEDLNHSHNGAACLRTAEALGLQDIVAVEIQNPYPLPDNAPYANEPIPRKITKATHRWLDLHRTPKPAEMLAWARTRGMRVFGAGPRATTTLDALPLDRPSLLVFGNERMGVLPSTLEACDDTFSIPMYGFVESYNVSVSVGMALGAVVARRRVALAKDGRTGDMPQDRQDYLLARWLLKDVKAAALIVARKLDT